MFQKATAPTFSIGRPKPTDRNKVVCNIIKYPGAVVNVRVLAQKIRNMGTALVKGMNFLLELL